MASIEQARSTATTMLSWLNKLIAKGNEKMIPASEIYSATEINFLAGKCDDLARMMRALPEDPMGDVKNSVNNLRQYKQVLTDAAGRLNTGETAHRISYRMSDRLGWVRFVIEALGRLEQNGGKAAAVVEAAKAVGTPRVKADAVPPELRSRVARYMVEIRASLERGYINQLTAQGLLNTLGTASHKWRFDSKLQSAWMLAGNIADLVNAQPGAQMKDISPQIAGEIKGHLARIARLLQQGDVPA